MMIKALKSFAGIVSMHKDEAKEIEDSIAAELVACGYAVESKSKKSAAGKGGKSDENKQNKS